MDINQILEEVGWGWYQGYVIANCSMAWMIINFWFVGTAILVYELTIAWGISAF